MSVTSNYNKKVQAMRKGLENGLRQSALILERSAKQKVPVDTGRLRSSLTYEERDFGTDSPGIVYGTNVDYAPYVEYGTSKVPARPYLLPALEENKERIKNTIAQAIKDAM